MLVCVGMCVCISVCWFLCLYIRVCVCVTCVWMCVCVCSSVNKIPNSSVFTDVLGFPSESAYAVDGVISFFGLVKIDLFYTSMKSSRVYVF